VLAQVGRTSGPAPGAPHLRPAEPGDEDDLLAWRNEPDAVRQSISGRAVEPAEHHRWLAERLEDPATRIWIVEVAGAPAGSVRIDVVDAVGTVSIAIAPDARGRGLGGATLRALLDLLEHDFQVEVLEALVRPANDASRRAFESAGFHPAGSRGTFTLLRWEKMEGRGRETAS
jgi:RimJ/RimL family protein N-acetyltransferase